MINIKKLIKIIISSAFILFIIYILWIIISLIIYEIDFAKHKKEAADFAFSLAEYVKENADYFTEVSEYELSLYPNEDVNRVKILKEGEYQASRDIIFKEVHEGAIYKYISRDIEYVCWTRIYFDYDYSIYYKKNYEPIEDDHFIMINDNIYIYYSHVDHY